MTGDRILPAETRIGHVHLKVADLNRAIGFYRDLLGFDLITTLGPGAAFLSAGGYSLSEKESERRGQGRALPSPETPPPP